MKKSKKHSQKKPAARRVSGHKPRAMTPAQIATAIAGLPAIGAPFHDGIYAGLSLENERPVALALMPDELEAADWKEAQAWAAEKNFSLPSRIDQLVLFKNLKSEFHGAWYWSGEPCAGGGAYAWGQGFDYGHQGIHRKYGQLRARAVRRIAI